MGMLNAKLYAKHKCGDKVKYKCDTGPGLTKQEFGAETDINNIMKRYNATGQFPVNMQTLQPVFGDVSQMGDFASALRRTHAAEEAFAELPADLRFRFRNDPELLVSFLHDDKNRAEAENLGLVAKKIPPPAAIPPLAEKPTPPKA